MSRMMGKTYRKVDRKFKKRLKKIRKQKQQKRSRYDDQNKEYYSKDMQ